MATQNIEESERLKVLIVAPIALPISKHLKYAGTERIIAGMHDVFTTTLKARVDSTVAATGDSDLSGRGRLVFTYDKALWSLASHERQITDMQDPLEKHIEFCLDYALKNDIDIIHDHAGIIESRAYARVRDTFTIPIVVTLHGDVHEAEAYKYRRWKQAQREGRPVTFIAISESQKAKFERQTGLSIAGVVHNGVPVEKALFVDWKGRQDYLFWIGRICSDKGTDLALKLAKATGRPLIIAGEVHTPDKEFYEAQVKPHITRFIEGATYQEQERSRNRLADRLAAGERVAQAGEVVYIGPLDDRQKGILYSRAYAQLVLNRWEEPFGLVMPEAMATGTPVIGTRRGSIPEVVADKSTGFLLPVIWVDKEKKILDEQALIAKAAAALEKIPSLKPSDCRQHVERWFSIDTTAKGYLSVYNSILKKQELPTPIQQKGARSWSS